MDLRGKRIEEGYTNLVTVEGDSVASSGKLQNGQGTDLGNVAVGGLSFNSSDSELQLPAGTTAERPASPSAGYARFNTDKGKVEIFTGASWLSIALEGAVQLEAATATVTGQDAVAELTGFISQFGTPASAFSVRQLGNTDVCMRVRRSNDNVEQNIGFTSDGDLDETALTTFVGANDGFVTTWYDQSVDNSTLPAEHGSGATASYSLRLVDSTYTGDAIRVRRSSDNTEQDIGFVDGELDTSTLETFCSGTNGFVTTWYDQSGSNNATQATAGSQPQIVSSGTTIKENGKPALDFDGGDFMSANSLASTFSGNETLFNGFVVTHNPATPSGTSRFYGFGSTSSANPIMSVGQSSSDGNLVLLERDDGGSAVSLSGSGDAEGSHVTTHLSEESSHILIDNGSEVYNNTTNLGTSTYNTFALGAIEQSGGAIQHFEGSMSELIIYDTDQSSNRESIELSQASYYDIGVSIGATQSTAGSQPKIVSSGTVIKENSVPAIDFDTTNTTHLSMPSSIVDPMSVFSVVALSQKSDDDHILSNGIGNNPGQEHYGYNDVLYIRDFPEQNQGLAHGLSAFEQAILSSFMISPTGEHFVQGSSVGTYSKTQGTLEIDTVSNIDGKGADGTMQEIIIYDSDKSADRTDIESDIATYYNITI